MPNPNASDFTPTNAGYTNTTGFDVTDIELDDSGDSAASIRAAAVRAAAAPAAGGTTDYTVNGFTTSVAYLQSLGGDAGFAKVAQQFNFTLSNTQQLKASLTLGTKKTWINGGTDATNAFNVDELTAQLSMNASQTAAGALGLSGDQSATLQMLASEALQAGGFKATWTQSAIGTISGLPQDENISISFSTQGSIQYTLTTVVGNIVIKGNVGAAYTTGSTNSSSMSGGVNMSMQNVDTGNKTFDLILDNTQLFINFNSTTPQGGQMSFTIQFGIVFHYSF